MKYSVEHLFDPVPDPRVPKSVVTGVPKRPTSSEPTRGSTLRSRTSRESTHKVRRPPRQEDLKTVIGVRKPR